MLNPGDEKSIPFELAKKDFGDPRSINDVIRIKDEYGNDMVVADRRAEVIRLQSLWQSQVPKFREYVPGDRSFLTDGISDMMPDVEVYDMDGHRIYMVCDDPYGDHVMAATTTVMEAENYRSKISAQQQEIDDLKRQHKIMMDRLGVNPEMLLDPVKVKPQDGALDTPTLATKEENPQMVYNPRTKRVLPKRYAPTNDPTSIEELEPETD
jgi:hypothetical protein